MLSNRGLRASRELADSVLNDGMELGVVMGSLLSGPVQASMPTINVDKDLSGRAEGNGLSDMEGFLQRFSMSTGHDNFDMHEGELAPLVGELIRRIEGTLRYARNDINPVIKTLFAKCLSIESETMGENYYLNNIKYVSKPVMLESKMFTDLYAPYSYGSSSQQIDNVIINAITKDLNMVDVINACKTGIVDLDQQITNLLSGDKEAVSSAINNPNYFLNREHKFGDTLNIYTSNLPVIAFLFLNGVINGKHGTFDFSELTLGQREQIIQRRAFYAKLIKTQNDAMVRRLDNDNIIVESDARRDNPVVVLNAKNFRKWQRSSDAAGAGPLIAFVKTGSNNETNLKENLDVYVKSWDDMSSALEQRNRAECDNAINRTIFDFLRDELKEDGQNKEEYASQIDALTKFVKTKRYFSSLNLPNYIREVVCTVMGKGTDAFEILTIMEQEMHDNEELTDKDAAIAASSHILAKWFATELTCTPA